MSDFRATARWSRSTPDFVTETFDRSHSIAYGSGTTIPASSAPAYTGHVDRVNPEEQLVGALVSCHMLTFLAYASRKRWVVDGYEDTGAGVLAKNAAGKMAVTEVVLRPKVTFAPGSAAPTSEELHAAHEKAHANCFIANSVSCAVKVEPQG